MSRKGYAKNPTPEAKRAAQRAADLKYRAKHPRKPKGRPGGRPPEQVLCLWGGFVVAGCDVAGLWESRVDQDTPLGKWLRSVATMPTLTILLTGVRKRDLDFFIPLLQGYVDNTNRTYNRVRG